MVYKSASYRMGRRCCDGGVDTSTVSAGDLENIIETETPPQSPAQINSETQPLMSDRRRRSVVVVGGDVDDDAKVSGRHHQAAAGDDDVKAPASVEPAHSPASSLPSSPQPSSPVAFSVCPLRLGKTFAFTSAEAETRPVNSAAEVFIQRQQEQVGRIAEYNKRTSLIDEAQLAVSDVSPPPILPAAENIMFSICSPVCVCHVCVSSRGLF